jgi:cytoskeletal protein RodZ
MQHSRFRRIATGGALALIATLPLTACGEPSLSPRPAQTATTPSAPTPSAVAGAGSPEPTVPSQPAGPKPASTTRAAAPKTSKPTSTKSSDTCLGAVRYDLDLQNTELALIKSMCLHTGGILRLKGIGPGLVTATPESLVSQTYEAGIVDLRFVRTGTVTVTIPQDEQTYTITVVVIA